MSEVLAKLGLTVDEVRRALGTPRPYVEKPKGYLSGKDQLRMQRRLCLYEGFMYARFVEGYHPGTIGRILSCSEESVRIRLRRGGFF